MCMICSTGRITKKKIAIFSYIGILIAVGTYFMFTTTNNIYLELRFATCSLAVFLLFLLAHFH